LHFLFFIAHVQEEEEQAVVANGQGSASAAAGGGSGADDSNDADAEQAESTNKPATEEPQQDTAKEMEVSTNISVILHTCLIM
jgi:ribosomal protein L12E/L44/L45/RPP1/RPP2